MVGPGKFDTEASLRVARLQKPHRYICLTLEQPGRKLLLVPRHSNFKAQFMVARKFFRQLIFETHQLSAVEKIRRCIVTQQHAQQLAFFDLFEIIEKCGFSFIGQVFELDIAVDLTDQPWRIFAYTPTYVASPAEIYCNLEIVTVALINFYPIAIEYGRVNFTICQHIE